ncbi:MAG: hypothetical protein FGM33_01390 [Candidatus Kapabacteria bacterium]|nr:hypothetical protein [Candidatus Kapabacteria bacterium]
MSLAIALVLMFSGIAAVSAADTVRVASYNLLKFSQDNEDGRIPMFRQILDSIRPDVVVCSEVADATVGPRFVSDVMRWAPFAATPYYDGPDTDILVLYNQLKFSLLGTRRIPTELRDIFEVTLEHLDKDGRADDTVVVYGLHLKASSSSSDEQQRTREMTALVSNITQRRNAVICGDYNVYRPDEPALQALIGPSAKRQFVDPLGSNWRRNDVAFASFYTQCTRATTIAGCGGGVDGGIDDRFDFILPSAELAPRVLTSTYTAFGNDGAARFNKSIDDPPNTKVSASMAASLKCASDHLPIYVDIVMGELFTSVGDDAATGWWKCDGRTITIMGGTPDVTIYSSQGRRVSVLPMSQMVQTIDDLPTGSYIIHRANAVVRAVIIR